MVFGLQMFKALYKVQGRGKNIVREGFLLTPPVGLQAVVEWKCEFGVESPGG